jgi:transposase
MPWKEPQIANERDRFVIRADAGIECFATLCKSFGISRVTGYRWLNRYRRIGNVRELGELSRRPHHIPAKVKPVTANKILVSCDISERLPTAIDHSVRTDEKRTTAEFNPLAWMIQLFLDGNPARLLEREFPNQSDRLELSELVTKGSSQERLRAISVMARLKGIPVRMVADALHIHPRTVESHFRRYKKRGVVALSPPKKPRCKDVEGDKRRLFALLHSPPSAHGINRTSWEMDDLHQVLGAGGDPMSRERIRKFIKAAGFRWRKAKVVLTSKDPDYYPKVASITQILSRLQEADAFFSVDEFGPFALKRRGGRKRIAPGENYFIPQWQRAKGWLIITAALELVTNQVTHFYSLKKNTEEMLKMADLLRKQYKHCGTIYLSWDAASWHISKRLFLYLEEANGRAALEGCPVIRIVHLPVGSQFLNVIESVFSGMSRAIIHNSDYPSVESAKEAIDRYFADRNAHFVEHPKRAGSKIWRTERVPSEFSEAQNCKDPRY